MLCHFHEYLKLLEKQENMLFLLRLNDTIVSEYKYVYLLWFLFTRLDRCMRKVITSIFLIIFDYSTDENIAFLFVIDKSYNR